MYIKIKLLLQDLILEKLTLIKEVNRMKQLNTHLESRLGEQERRLCLVTNELSKTWHVVGRLRRHHHQLHTHEKILKYELQQKRKLLNELKEELEYCREKWEQAREKNSQSEKDWRKLRTEFSNRKLKPEQASFNNSAESGYSDERPSDTSESNDENEYLETKVKCKKKFKKSFETIVDSSTDFNLAAEREDPASDMLDVADLPLDTQEDNHGCDVSDLCNSVSVFNNIKQNDETEDEATDTANDAYLEEISIAENLIDDSAACNKVNIGQLKLTNCENVVNDINNRCTTVETDLASNSSIFIANEANENSVSENTKSTTCINNPSCSNVNYLTETTTSKEKINNNAESSNSECKDKKFEESRSENSERLEPTAEIDFSAILESIKKQNERLQLKDQRLENLEKGCASVVTNISRTLSSGDEIMAKLNNLHTHYNTGLLDETESPKQENTTTTTNLVKNITAELDEPSSSRDIDHEARFAARDLRLKRLEEQTKSLVNKVNKTATKGVKIHYKLEELHNIYGSEHSRSETPSEDSEDISQNNEDTSNE